MRSTFLSQVLAIAPRTRHLGIAVLESGELVRFGVKTFPGKKTVGTLLPEVERYLDQTYASFRPERIAIEEVFYAQARRSMLLREMTAAIRRWARRKGIICRSYLPTAVKDRVCEGKRTRRQLAEAMVRRYKFLSSFLKPGRGQYAREYWQQMFDAVALAVHAAGDRESSARQSVNSSR